MPYIHPEDRERFKSILIAFDSVNDSTLSEGELNYLLSSMVKRYWEDRPRYETIAIITGVLENVKQEFYRRIAVPYEDKKILENGDVYSPI